MPSFKRNRVVNTSLVLREIWRHRRISRVQIARNLDLDKSTVSNIVGELIEQGIIQECEVGRAGPQGGRRPVFLTLDGSKGRVLGVELKPDGYCAVSVDLSGSLLEAHSGACTVTERGLVDTFLDILDRSQGSGGAKPPVFGIGLGVSGIVDPEHGLIRSSLPLGIRAPLDVRELLARRCTLPVYLENDANACAWAELAFHRTKRLRNFIFVLLELRDPARLDGLFERTALGLGIVVEGRGHHGSTFSAGEFRSALRPASARGQFSLSREESMRVTEDPELLSRLVDELARNVALLAVALDADEIYIGGDIERYGKLVTATMERALRGAWPYPGPVHCRLRFSSLGRQAVAYGAAGLVLHRLFADLGSMGRPGRRSPLLPAGMAEKFRTGTIGFQTIVEERR